MDRRDQNPVLRGTIPSFPRFPWDFISSTQDTDMQDRRCVSTDMVNDGQRTLGQSTSLCEMVGAQGKGRISNAMNDGSRESEVMTTKGISPRLAVGSVAGLERVSCDLDTKPGFSDAVMALQA
jgi:hypothetical protein